jgi:hypothetical protein
VDLACEAVGGSSHRGGTELAVTESAGDRFHSGTDSFTHETVFKALFGMDGDGPRW